MQPLCRVLIVLNNVHLLVVIREIVLLHGQTIFHLDVFQMDEASELEDLEQFAKDFKQRRIKMGFTQVKLLKIMPLNLRVCFS